MTCFYPLKAYRSAVRTSSGKRALTFNPLKAYVEGGGFAVPCGQCSGCRSARSEQWAVRCWHEAKMHEHNCFGTLTFSDEHLPSDYSVRKRDWQLFMKRFRAKVEVAGVKFAGVGEYGDETLRPHYHFLFFGYDFPDKKVFSVRNGNRVFKSELLEELWPFGMCELGEVTPKSAAYCARYSRKKITGDRADEHYWRRSPVDGEMHRVEPEFMLMSRRPGLGSAWFDHFASDAFPSDFVIVDGRKKRPPQYYLGKLAERDQEALKRRRKAFSVQPVQKANNTRERLAVREFIHDDRMSRLIRPL